jgi:bis(5'-adenosyl)-triphosphatase
MDASCGHSSTPLSRDIDGNNEDDHNDKFTIDTIATTQVKTNGDSKVPQDSTTPHPLRSDIFTNGGTQFGKFYIPEECIFYRTELSVAFVNLRPIVPSHVLVIPMIESSSSCNSTKRKTHLCDLSDDEYDDLWRTVRYVQSILQQHFHNMNRNDSTETSTTSTTTTSSTLQQRLSYNVAVQDGKDAGQSVHHVHVHILPRMANDFEHNDDVYEELDRWEPRQKPLPNTSDTENSNASPLQVPNDEERKGRTMLEMTTEAAMYRSIVTTMQPK